MQSPYDIIAVGSGFATSFFLHRYLRTAPASARVLVLERGPHRPHAQRLAERTSLGRDEHQSYVNRSVGTKKWVFTFGFGGSSQCWWGVTPRMLPSDFRLKSLYGVGRDWPIDYETLEPFYCDAEELLGVAGPSDDTPFVRSRPYPLPPHRLSRPDRAFKEAYPKHFFAQPCARPTRGLSGRAPACCNAAVCTICPIDSKFTVLNGMKHVYRDPRVELRTGATALRVEVGNKVATGVVFREGERVETARSELVVLGANGIFNPFLLLKSGLDGPQTGKGLVEQTSSTYLLQLNGMDSFQGSTSLTGHGYSLYDGEHRARYAGGLIETSNRPEVRPERGKWLQFLRVKVIFEDLREDRNHVTVSEEDPEKPAAVYRGLSEYAKRGMEAAGQKMVKFVSALPVERMNRMSYRGETEAHMLGTTVMGDRENESVVDRKSVHHRVRNLVVLGGSTFPTAAPANPTLTICALALYSAEGLYG